MPVPLLEGDPVKEQRVRTERPNNGRFRRKAMYKNELARWYGVSRNHFVAEYLPPVMKQLKKKGYTADTRLLSLAMVNIICDFQDDPVTD